MLLDFEKPDPVSGKGVKVKDGRWGPYITDGETNVTVPRGTDPATLTFERAVELIAEKRAKGPAKKRTTTRKTSTAKKTTTKKASTAKKATATKKTSTTATRKKTTSAKAGTEE